MSGTQNLVHEKYREPVPVLRGSAENSVTEIERTL